MDQKATEKLNAGDRFGLHGVRFAIFVAKRHFRFRHIDDAVIGNGHSKNIAAQVVQDRLFAATVPYPAIIRSFFKTRNRRVMSVATCDLNFLSMLFKQASMPGLNAANDSWYTVSSSSRSRRLLSADFPLDVFLAHYINSCSRRLLRQF